MNPDRLAELLKHPYLTAPYPKSLDRFDFTETVADGLNEEDGAATLTAFTTSAVGKAWTFCRVGQSGAVSGGGRRNPTMMHMLVERAKVELVPVETLGWRGDAVEAECFCFPRSASLAQFTYQFSGTTSVPEPMTGGKLVG